MSRLSNDVAVMRTVLTNNVNVLIQQTLSMIGAIIVMLVLNWRLTGFILLLTPIIVALGAAFGIWLRRTSTEIQDELAGATVVTEEVLQNIREVKVLCANLMRLNGTTRRLDAHLRRRSGCCRSVKLFE